MVSAVQVSVLGPIRVDDGRIALAPRDRVVLASLASRIGEDASAGELAEALWGDDPPASWTKVVPGCVMRLRRTLGPAAIQTTPAGYRLEAEHFELDARRFEETVARAHDLLLLGEHDRAAHVFEAALAMWRGKPYADLENWSPARIEAARLDELRLEAEEALLSARLHAGPLWEVVGAAHARVAEAPLRERRWALLAEAQYRDGRQGDALNTLRTARQTLVNELGLDPGPELVGLEHAILNQDPALQSETTYSEPSTTCPYFGLRAADVDDAELFFGRDDEVRDCLRSLASVGVLAVAGPSGIGKSSLVRAGIAAELRRNGRSVTIITPGNSPMQVLEQDTVTTASALVVDQCEEALSSGADPAEQSRFFTSLTQYAHSGLLVLTLRADRLGEIASFPEFARLVERNLFLLGPMPTDDIRAMIELPARQAGLLLEPGLVDLLIRDAEGEPGALPLLSHALRQTWRRREGRTLTVDGYTETGGITGAIAQSAEEVYAELPAPQRAALRDLMLRLIEPTSDSDPIRIRVPRHLVTTDAADEQLVEQLVDARLLTSDAEVVEIAHEALALSWPRLRVWLDEDMEGQRLLRHLTLSATSWQAMGRPEAELYRGPRLAGALSWQDTARPSLTVVEREFLQASGAQQEAEYVATQVQLRRERRTVRRLRWLTAVAAVLALVAGTAWSVAVGQRNRADERAMVAQARGMAAQALVEPRYDRALLLAVDAVGLWDSPETRGNLLATIGRSPWVSTVVDVSQSRLLELDTATASNGTRVAALDDERVTVLDLEAPTRTALLGTPGATYFAATLSPDGSSLAAAWVNDPCAIEYCPDFGLQLLDAGDLSAAGTDFGGFGSPVADIAFSPEGDRLAAIAPLPYVGPPNNLAIWRVDQPQEPIVLLDMTRLGAHPFVIPNGPVPGWLTFSPDGKTLYASGAGPTVAFDAATGRRLRSLGGNGGLALSPDGTTIALTGRNNDVTLVDTTTGDVTARLTGHSSPVTALTFNDDGTRVATASADETAAIWDPRNGEQIQVLRAHVGSVHGVAFTDDGGLVTAGADGSVIGWDLLRENGLTRQAVKTPPLASESGSTPLVSSGTAVLLADDEQLVLLDVETNRLTPLAVAAGEVTWAAFHPGDDRVVTVTKAGEVALTDASNGAVVARQARRDADNRGAVTYTPDGANVVVADEDGKVYVLDGATLDPVGEPLQLPGTPMGVRATHDGVIAVTLSDGVEASPSTEVVFADIDTGEVLRQVEIDVPDVRTNFSPDGTMYGYGGFDGTVGAIDLATWEVTQNPEPLHDGPVSWVTFSPDGDLLFSTGFDGQMTMSYADDVVPFARLDSGRPSMQATAVFLDDGHILRTAYSDGTVLDFDTDPRAWLSHACAVAGVGTMCTG